MRSDLLSDMAWCHVRLGQNAVAISLASKAEASITPETQLDDRAATYTRLGWLSAAIGNGEETKRYEAQAKAAWDEFAQLQGRIVELLGPVAEGT